MRTNHRCDMTTKNVPDWKIVNENTENTAPNMKRYINN